MTPRHAVALIEKLTRDELFALNAYTEQARGDKQYLALFAEWWRCRGKAWSRRHRRAAHKTARAAGA